jgi:predicted site-specific integrase-resolvase
MGSITEWCDACKDKVEWIHVRDVCEMTGVTRQTVCSWMNRGFLHTLLLPSGRRLVCKRSVRAHQVTSPK